MRKILLILILATLPLVATSSGRLQRARVAGNPIHTLTDGETITPNWNNSNIQIVTLGGNRTLANGTNPADGATYIVIVKQDAGAPRTLAYGDKYLFEGGADPVLSTGNGDVDVLTFLYNLDDDVYYGLVAQEFE